MQTNAEEIRSEFAPLYCKFQGQAQAQDAFFELDPEARTLTARINPEIGNAIPFSVWHGRLFRIAVNNHLTGKAAANLIEDEEVQRLAGIVCDGYHHRWDGSNEVGILTDKAAAALHELRDMLTPTEYDNYTQEEQVDVWEASDWFDAEPPKVYPNMTGTEIRDMAERLADEARSDSVLLDRDDLIRYLTSLCESLAV